MYMTKKLRELIEKAQQWPEDAQWELAQIVSEMDAGLKGGTYHATLEELAGIDRGLKDARAGRFATDEEVEAVFAKHRA